MLSLNLIYILFLEIDISYKVFHFFLIKFLSIFCDQFFVDLYISLYR